jgi:hypothetical protein
VRHPAELYRIHGTNEPWPGDDNAEEALQLTGVGLTQR